MADKKISQLTDLPAASVAPSNDVLAIVDTSATETKKVTAKALVDGALNAGTANGVLYLNGSKEATSGSALTFNGTSMTFADNSKAIFGAGSDLQIYHDGAGSYIDDQGTGPIRIRSGVGGSLRFQDLDGDDLILAASNGAVTLYYNNSAKLATTATGIDVTGSVTADGLTVNSGTTNTTATFESTDQYAFVNFKDNTSTDGTFIGAEGNNFIVQSDSSKRLLTAALGGDISFYEDTGTSAKFFWDASAEALGIGTTSPSYKLHVENNAASTTSVSVINTSASSGAYAQFRVQGDAGQGYFGYASSGNAAGGLYDADCVYLASENTASALCIGTAGNSAPIRFFTNGSSAASERMRLDSSGNLGLGVTPSAWWGSTKAIDISTYGAISQNSGGGGGVALYGNSYEDTSGTFKYKQSYYATLYRTYAGQHQWFTAPSGTAGNTITFTQAMTLDASGRLLVGGTSASVGSANGAIEVFNTGGDLFSLSRFTNGTGGSAMYFQKSRGATVGSNTIVQSGDSIGAIYFRGANGTGYSEAAYILAAVDGTPGASADMPGRLVFATSADGSATPTERARITNGGDLLVGTTTTSSITGSMSTLTLGGTNATVSGGIAYQTNGTVKAYDYVESDVRKIQTVSGVPIAFIAAGTERARITAAGELLVGTTSAFNTAAGRANVSINGSSTAMYNLGVAGASAGYLYHSGTDMWLNNVQNGILSFYTNNTERARITATGQLLVGLTSSAVGEYLSVQASNSSWMARVANTNASPRGEQIIFTGASPNGTANWFLYCEDSTAQRASIRSNGGLANYQSNNVDLSDARTKKDIAPAASMWDKIGALEIVTYKYNDQTHDDVNVGVIAQQVESVEPVWVDNDSWGEAPEGEEPLKTVYTKDITFAAIKALQEAMARIEKLEAKVAALEAA